MATTTTTTTTTTSPSHNLLTLKAHTGSCHVARYDTKGRYLLTAGSDRTIKLWSASAPSSSSNGSASNPIKTYTSGHNYDILSLDITSDNSKFASAGVDKNIVVWDVATSSILRRFNAQTGTVFDVEFAGAPVNTDGGTTAGGNDGSLLVTGGFDATLRMYDLRAQGAWRPILESKEGNDAIQCLQVRGSTVWTGSVDGVVRMYDVRMGSVTQDTIDEPIVSLSPSHTSSVLLVSTTSSTHRLLDTSDGTLLQTFKGHKNEKYPCRSVLSRSEEHVIAGDEEGMLRIWDVLTAKQVHTAPTHQPHHDRAILWTECNPTVDGQVVTAGADGLVKVWSV